MSSLPSKDDGSLPPRDVHHGEPIDPPGDPPSAALHISQTNILADFRRPGDIPLELLQPEFLDSVGKRIPDGPERILRVFESRLAHRQELEKQGLTAEINDRVSLRESEKIGTVVALIGLFLCLSASVALAAFGAYAASAAAAGTTVLGVLARLAPNRHADAPSPDPNEAQSPENKAKRANPGGKPTRKKRASRKK